VRNTAVFAVFFAALLLQKSCLRMLQPARIW
jgi:hypothetical protein